MTGPTVIRGHDGEPVTLTDVGAPVESNLTHNCPEFTEGCWSCVLDLPWEERVRRVAAARKRHVYPCHVADCVVCEHVAARVGEAS